jgi:hypothetical protein
MQLCIHALSACPLAAPALNSLCGISVNATSNGWSDVQTFTFSMPLNSLCGISVNATELETLG